MKKLLFLLIALLPLIASAQKQSAVTLKNGTELIGVIKSIDPTDALTIIIADVEMTIKMADVARIQEIKDTFLEPNLATRKTSLGEKDKLVVTDFADYPDSFDLKVGNASIKMILVRGGDMNMGYDGRGSWGMKSEPVHQVCVTSFYISKDFIRSEIVKVVKGKSHKKEFHAETQWNDANNIVEGIAQKSGIPVRLPTEAEWEYAACSPVQEIIFSKSNTYEYCNDIYGEFQKKDPILEPIIDPIGPNKGRYFVVRAYAGNDGKFNRAHYTRHQYLAQGYPDYFRIAIKVKDVIDSIK